MINLIQYKVTKLQMRSTCSPNIPGSKFPEINKIHNNAAPRRNILHLLSDVLLAGARDVDIVNVAGGVVAAHGFAEVGGAVSAGAVDE